MSAIGIGTRVHVSGDDSRTGTVVSWDDTRKQYLVDLGDDQPHYLAESELEVVASGPR